jgi:hypothetical protein
MPLWRRWRRQFADAICYPPPPALEPDGGNGDTVAGGSDSGSVAGGTGVVQKAGGPDFSGGAESALSAPPRPGAGGLAVHLLTVVFKFLLATVPPCDWGGGFPAFFGALAWIAVFIAIIEQTATSLGCAWRAPSLVIGGRLRGAQGLTEV